jgi:uncharacterized protein (TIRG00374 family)
LAGSAVVLALLFTFLPLGELWGTMKRLPLLLWLLVLGGYLLAHCGGVAKWRLMVNLANAGLNFAQAARCYFAGLFSTLFLPSIVGGDVVRAGLALRLGRSKAGVLLGSVFDRLIDVVALGAIAALGTLLSPGALAPASRRVFLVLVAALAAAGLILLALATQLPVGRFSYRMRRRLVRVRQAGRSMAQQPQYFVVALGIALTVQTVFILLMTVVASACQLQLAFRAWLFAWPLAKLSALLPVSQGGIGVREAALAGLLAPFGARAVLVVAVGLVWETIILAGGLVAGLVSLLLGRSSSWKASRLEATAVQRDA